MIVQNLQESVYIKTHTRNLVYYIYINISVDITISLAISITLLSMGKVVKLPKYHTVFDIVFAF